MRTTVGWAAVAAITAGTPGALLAQTAGEQAAAATSRTATFDRAYFSPFAPSTALDIVQRVPGFQLDLGSTQSAVGSVDVRGFAGVAGNVVINGARPSSKAETLESTLARLPAQRVVRVEVGPGDLFGADYAGKAQVLNIILSAEAGYDANVTASARRHYTGYVNTDIEASALVKRGASTFNLSGSTGRDFIPEEGTDVLTDLRTGAEKAFRRKYNPYFNRNAFLAGSWALERGSTDAFRANIRWAPTRYDLEQENRVRQGTFLHDDTLLQKYRNPVLELGGDVTRPLAGGAVKFVALATRRKRNDRETYLGRSGLLDEAGTTVVGGYDQQVSARRNETIGRVSWNRANLAGFSLEGGAEAAFNTLDSAVELFLLGPGGARARIDLPIDQAEVEEKRGEVYVSVGRNLSPALRLDGGINYEFSTLQVRGDATADRSLRFLKPNVAIDWKPAGGWHARMSIKRTVAQLNFYDFISLAELANDRVNGGNADLLPQRSWEVRATLDRTILKSGLIKLDLGHDRISQLQDQILTEEGFSAPGNIGTGKRSFAAATLDAPLDSFGLSGTRLKLNGQVQRTRVFDPISGETRDFSGFFPRWGWEAELRRDAGKLSYGATVQDRAPFTFFRADEVDTNFNIGPFGTAFVEYRPTARTSATLNLGNIFANRNARDRLFFEPNRSSPEPVELEKRRRSRHVTVGIALRQSFGGGAAKG